MKVVFLFLLNKNSLLMVRGRIENISFKVTEAVGSAPSTATTKFNPEKSLTMEVNWWVCLPERYSYKISSLFDLTQGYQSRA